MRVAVLTKTKHGVSWSANYAEGGRELMSMIGEVRRVRNDPFFNVGNRDIKRRQKALDSFTELNRRQGYETREDAEFGARVKAKPVLREYKRSVLEKVIDFFYDEVRE